MNAKRARRLRRRAALAVALECEAQGVRNEYAAAEAWRYVYRRLKRNKAVAADTLARKRTP